MVKFVDPSALRRHIKRFHNETNVCNPYVCRLCKKQFKVKKDLKKHLMVHIPRKQRELKKCNQCDSEFVSNSCLQRHNKKFHL